MLSAVRLINPILLPLPTGCRTRRPGGEQPSGKCQIRFAISDDYLFFLNSDVSIVCEGGQSTLHLNFGLRDLFARGLLLLGWRFWLLALNGFTTHQDCGCGALGIVGRSRTADGFAISRIGGRLRDAAYWRLGEFFVAFAAHRIRLVAVQTWR